MQNFVFAFSDTGPWGRCLSHFLQTCSRSNSAETRREYTRTLSLLFSETQKAPDDITQEDVLSFIHSLSRSPRNPGAMVTTGTINTRLAILKAFYGFASTYTITGPDGHPTYILQRALPTTGIRTSKPSLEYRALSAEEVERIFSVIPVDTVRGARDHCLLLFYLITARRRNEIARLKFGDISPAILIDEHGIRRSGFTFAFRGKGASQEVDMQELPLLVKQSLDRYLELSGRKTTMKPDSPLFVPTNMTNKITFDQSKQLTDTSINRRLKVYTKKAGLDERKISLHCLRHTSARERYSAGEDLRSIQRVLRHTNISTTDVYLRKLTSITDPGAKLLEKRFGHL